MQAARGAGLVPPGFLIDKAMAQMTLSLKTAREGGAVVESIVRRTKNIPGTWGDRARSIAVQEIAPALEEQLHELQLQRKSASNEPGIAARPHGEEFYRWALKASTTTSMPASTRRSSSGSRSLRVRPPRCSRGRRSWQRPRSSSLRSCS